MELAEREHSGVLILSLTTFGLASFIAGSYCFFVLIGKQSNPFEAQWQNAFYGSWFGLAIVSTIAILSWKRWGVTLLGVATLIVAVVNIFMGAATWSGAILSIFIAVILAVLLKDEWEWFD